MRYLLFVLTLLVAMPACSSEKFIRIDTRQGVTVLIFYIKNDEAYATVLLFSGGKGGMGKRIGGQPSSKNFLVRSRHFFSENGLNVAIFGLPSDKKSGYIEYSDRLVTEHIQDIKKVVEYLKIDTGHPVWLVGTSRGTISVTAAAIDFGNQLLDGIVLTSSVVSYKKTGAVPTQDIGKIQIPVLVVHHHNDSCVVCSPQEVPNIIKGLKNTPVKKLIMIAEGENTTGDPCEAHHYHGFIGIEKTTVDSITTWIKNPTP